MKFLFAALVSLIFLVGGSIHIGWFTRVRKELHHEDWSGKKKETLSKIFLIIWAVATIALFALTFAGVAFRGL